MTDYTGSNFTSIIRHDTYPEIHASTESNLPGKYVFISGASKGIGKALAISYAKAGASGIAIAARSNLSEVEQSIHRAATDASKSAPRVLNLSLDVTDRASIEDAARATGENFGHLDILINNAGYLETFQPIADSDPDDWWRSWDINVRGPYLMTRAFLPLMLKGGDKQILNLSSVGAHSFMQGASGYQTAKFAILKFTELTNAEYGEQGILAYAIHPGGVATELAKQMPEDLHGLLTDTPELAADAMVFLTQQRRTWLAGRYISVTWDLPELISREKEIVEADKLKMRMVL
ncbi:MAG: hypothetical protein M1837_005987 [Sclerophora amabilis]|nr:MAG: hypothetical protein M1837_005987 [Sclerophora amabilis]